MGMQHGKQLADSIRLLHEKYLKVFIGSPTKRLLALGAARAFEQKILPEHLAEVTALAQQTGIDVHDLVLAQCFLDLTPMSACSTITLPAEAAPDRVARFGRNLDFPSLNLADKHTVILVFRPTDGRYAFAAVGWPGMIGVLSGMNEHGLALANMEVLRPALLPMAMPYTLLYRTVLEKCRTVDEAIALLEKTPRQTPNNLMLMDAAGNRAVVEIRPAGIAVRRGPVGAALISTNHQRGADGDTPGRCERYDLLHITARERFGKIDETVLEKMLASASQGNMTLQSMVFEPANRAICISAGKDAARGTFHRLELKRYFGEGRGNPKSESPKSE
jgi:predicted choloylglycine hydrolase